MTETAIDVADALRVAADKAADLLEKLDAENETMKAASSGILPDGTPIEDVLSSLREVQAENAQLHAALRSIASAASQLRASGLAGQRGHILALCRRKV
jgi:hypothetical protein